MHLPAHPSFRGRSPKPGATTSLARFVSSARTALVALLVPVAYALACGSRTGLLYANPDGAALVGIRDAAPDSLIVQCTPGTFQLERATSQVMFVLDRSGSMRFTLSGEDPGATAPLSPNSRWRILERALSTALPLVENSSGSVEIGATFFPEEFDVGSNDPLRACGVSKMPDVAPKRNSSQDILRVFQNTSPVGGTPTADAIESALASLKAASRRVVARSMILATDGAPNCNERLDYATCFCTQVDSRTCREDPQNGATRCLDDLSAINRLKSAYEMDGVPTYVIGIGSAQQEPAFVRTLNDMAVAGGRSLPGQTQYYDAQSPEQLSSAFDEIGNAIAACNFVTPSAPIKPDAISIDVGGVQVIRDPLRRDGWDWVDRSYGQIALFGKACDRVARGGIEGVVKATVACD
jgi:hypothetical protein